MLRQRAGSPKSTRLFTLAESLGGVESLMNYPDAMTHASVRGTELAVPEELVRLSVGIENVDDLHRRPRRRAREPLSPSASPRACPPGEPSITNS